MLFALYIALAFLAGVLLACLSPLAFALWMFVLPPIFLFRKPYVGVILLGLVLGLWRVDFYEGQAPLSVPYDQSVELVGRVVEEVDRRADHQKITVETEYGRVLAKISLYGQVAYGDKVQLYGVLEAPSDDIDGFNYARYLARYRVWLVMNKAYVQVLEEAGFSVRGFLYGLKTGLEGKLNRLYFEPESSFAAGLLLGSRKGMPQVLADAFQRTGLTHIVAISGYNISLVIVLMFGLFSFMPLKSRVALSTVAIVLFVLLVGASAAVVRAGVMGVLTLWGLFAGRRSQVFFALLWSAVLMVLWNPYILAYDVGFQLSFASTFGLLVFAPILEEKIPKQASLSVLREAFVLTMAAQIATFPFMLFHFGRLSMIAPLANVVTAPFLPFAMLFGALSLVAAPFAWLAWFHLFMVEFLAMQLAKLPFIEWPLSLSGSGFVFSLFLLLWMSVRSYKSTLVRAFVRECDPNFSRVCAGVFERHEKQ